MINVRIIIGCLKKIIKSIYNEQKERKIIISQSQGEHIKNNKYMKTLKK